MPLRIAQVFFKYPPAIGGLEIFVQDLSEGLRDRGLDVRVVTSTLRKLPTRRKSGIGRVWRRLTSTFRGGETSRPDDDPFLDGPYSLVNGIPVTRLEPKLPLRRRLVLPELHRTLIELAPDLIHAHDIWRHPFEVSIDVARELGIPLFLSPVYQDRSGERNGARWMQELRRIAAKVPAHARVLFCTPWEERALAQAGIRFENTNLLPPSIDFDELGRIPVGPVPGVPVDKRLVTFVGRLNPAKGIDLLIASFSRALARLGRERDPAADSVHLVIAGFRDAHEDYGVLAAEYGVSEHVTVLPDRPREDIVNLLRASSIFALPSRCETFGIVVIEAWATGNLVLVSDHWALPYVVQHEHNGIVCASDSWTEWLVRAIRDVGTPWGRRLIENGEATVRSEHRREDRLDYLVGLIEEAAASADRRDS